MNKFKQLRLAILISGGGSTAAMVTKSCRSGTLRGKVEVVAVIASKNEAGEHVRRLGVKPVIVQRRFMEISTEQFGEELLQQLRKYQPNLIAQLGWLPLTPGAVVSEYSVFNQHPGKLDPGRVGVDKEPLSFGGKGMHGLAPTCATIAYHLATREEKAWTEATTHIVTSKYDEGDLLRTQRMELVSVARAKHIASRNFLQAAAIDEQKKLLRIEYENVIATLFQIYEQGGKMLGYRRRAPLIPEENIPILLEAKQLAREIFPNG